MLLETSLKIKQQNAKQIALLASICNFVFKVKLSNYLVKVVPVFEANILLIANIQVVLRNELSALKNQNTIKTNHRFAFTNHINLLCRPKKNQIKTNRY